LSIGDEEASYRCKPETNNIIENRIVLVLLAFLLFYVGETVYLGLFSFMALVLGWK